MAIFRRIFSFVRWLVRLEFGIWRSLFLWVTRRVPGLGPGVEAFSYSRDITPLMAAFIFGSTLELVVVHILLPWETVRLVADVLSIWGLLWMLGYLASVRVFPHLLACDGLHIRYGTTVDIWIPWDAIAGVTARRGSVSTRKAASVERTGEGIVVNVAVLRRTKVDLSLHRPTRLDLPSGREDVTEVRLYVDNPKAFVKAARQQLADEATAA